MAIKRGSKVDKSLSNAAMSDLMFLLLVFMIIATTLIKPNMPKVEVDLPKNEKNLSKEVDDIEPPRVTIEYVGANNYEFYVNDEKVDGFEGVERTLKALLKLEEGAVKAQSVPILLHCDKRVSYEEAVKMLLMAQENGFRLLLATKAGQQ